MEARDHGTSVDEHVRFRAYDNQLIDVHLRLREMLEDLREGGRTESELGVHCLAFCAAVARHHTAEDIGVFPILAARHPELRAFLAELERDHAVIAEMLTRLTGWARGPARPSGRAGRVGWARRRAGDAFHRRGETAGQGARRAGADRRNHLLTGTGAGGDRDIR